MIWLLTNPNRIPLKTRKIIEQKSNQLLISDVSLFEIAIKQTIGKLPDFRVKISQIVEQLNLQSIFLVPLSIEAIGNYDQIPLLPQHRDPFDRMLLSISFTQNIPIISSDEKFLLYGDFVKVIWQ